MDKLLTDHGDPEKRIADLEHRLAARTRAAGPPPSGPQDAGPSRRFVASAAPPSTKQMMKYTHLVTFAGMAALGLIYMALFLIGALVGADNVMKVAGFVVSL